MFLSSPLALRVCAALICAFACAYALTPSVGALAERVHAIDLPGEERKIHKRPVPRLGGIAILAAFFAALLSFTAPGGSLGGVLRGALLIALMGAADDCFSLRSPLKLAVQLIAALLAWRGGARIEVLGLPFSGAAHFVAVGALGLPLTLLWLTACTNALNLIDGLDGLAAGVAAIAALSMLLIAAAVGEAEIAVFLAALAGSCLGFLPFNRCPARIFMGDVGSQLLGFLLGAAALLGMFKSHALLGVFAPLLALGLPLGDTAFAFLRRALHGQNPLRADRGHIHHRLLDAGLGERRVVLLLYALSGMLGLLAVAISERGETCRALCLAVMSAAAASALSLLRRRALLRRKQRRGAL